MRAFGEALEVIPYTLAENAGLQAISIVTELRNRRACVRICVRVFVCACSWSVGADMHSYRELLSACGAWAS